MHDTRTHVAKTHDTRTHAKTHDTRTTGTGGRARAAPALCVLVAAALLGCGAETPAPEQRLAEARESLVAARDDVGRLETRVEKKREAVERAERALSKARQELQKAESELARARARIDERATNVALFRAVQSALLESEALEDYAIRVEVDGDGVILHGVVDEPAQRRAAVETARAITGVDSVMDEIRVRGSDAPEAAGASASSDAGSG